MNQKTNDMDDNRYFSDYRKAFKRIKKGVIIAFIFASVIITAEVISKIHYDWIEIIIQKHNIRYEEGIISYDTYSSLRRNLRFEQDFLSWISLIVTDSAKVAINIGFLLIILGLLSIPINRSLTKKMRRLGLILAGAVFISFMVYLTFGILLSNIEVIKYYPPIYWH